MTDVSCPVCGQRFDMDQTSVKPFCSGRCQKIDIGRWFNEDYGLPWEPEDHREDQTPTRF